MLLDISRLTRRALFCLVRFPRWSGWKYVNRFLPGHPFVKRYLCRGHTVNSSTCFWLGAIKPPQLKRTSASPICVFPSFVFPLFHTECGQMVKYIIRTRLYWNDSNILFSRCRSTMWTLGKKGATHFEDAIVFNIDRKWWMFSEACVKIL